MIDSVYHGVDDAERIQLCLNCTVPAELCHGERLCRAAKSMRPKGAKAARYEQVRALYNSGLTHRQIAEKLGLTAGYINRIYNGGGII